MPVNSPIFIEDDIFFNPWTQGVPAVSLSSDFPDLYAVVLTDSATLVISTAENTVLEESYKPFNNGVHFKGLREILTIYLRRKNLNLLIEGPNTQVSENFTFSMNGDNKQGEVIYCRIRTDIPAAEFKGNLFLTTQYLKKVTTVRAKEFLTFFFANAGVSIGAKMYYRLPDGNIIATNYVPIISGVTNFHTFDTSFARIKTYFPNIPADSCLYYRIGNSTYNVEYMIDRSNYLTLHQLVFMNAFGVAETLLVRGEVIRHIDPSFSEGKVNRVSRKWNQRENETFEASSGKIFYRSEYDLWRDMFMSPDVYVYVNDEPRKIFVTEAKNSINKLPGLNGSLKFTFRFADEADTWEYMQYREWILTDGVWNDGGVWLDTGEWNDTP